MGGKIDSKRQARTVETGRPTIRQVADRASVGTSTVSRVLNDSPDVSPAVRARVLDAVAELAYQPDLLASSLRKGSTRTVGFVVSDIANPLFADIARVAEETFQRAGYGILLWNSHGDSERDEAGIAVLASRRVDGFILSLSDEARAETLSALSSLSAALVLLDRDLPGVTASAVLSDHERGMKAGIDHLVELGHERIALITGPLNLRPSRLRVEAFRKALDAHDLTVPDDLIGMGSFTAGFGEHCAHRLFGLEDPPTALIVGGNRLLEGALRGLQNRGIKIGRDLALICCDDLALAQLYSPPITVIARDIAQMGRRAAEILLEMLGGNTRPIVETLPTELVVRESTFSL
jgi:LacI family transcriptional regulator